MGVKNGVAGQSQASGKRSLIIQLSILLALGFLLTSVVSYIVSKREIHEAIVERELPLTSDNIYSEIQKDLIRPIFVSSMMASDTFLRDWVLQGERELPAMTKYLGEIRTRFGTFSSFFVSEKTHNYYHPDGLLKTVAESDPHDAWYFRTRALQEPYEINVDLDTRKPDTLAIFINYRVFDYDRQLIGVTGVGLTVDAVRQLLSSYQQRYQRKVYFVDPEGKVMPFGEGAHRDGNIRDMEGLRDIADSILSSAKAAGGVANAHLHAATEDSTSWQYRSAGSNYLLNVRYMPEMKWFLFVEKREDTALTSIRRTLYVNIAVCVAIMAVVLFLTSMTLNRYQLRLEDMATTDQLSGLFNRHAFDVLINQALPEHRRNSRPLCAMLIDVDHFKVVNDRYGHQRGDQLIEHVATIIRSQLRESDIACRWGGEEFLVLLRDCDLNNAVVIADKLREHIIEQPLPDAGGSIAITVSAGVSQLADNDTAESLVERADRALYAAKGAGRNCVETA